ncbi:hypothetical protein HHI36_003562 [Cryptolaemus montrouzieri]|uniref:Chemosensory protein n=1 Tax=Cryptolaemus montrouzieri TaxID=559131 RepID=A0ABD2PDR9_9CUCU
MDKQIIFSFIVLMYVAACEEQKQYTNMYDNVDLEEVVKNERLLRNYVLCLMDQGNCTPDGAELKRNLPDAIENDCEKCTEKQKEGANFIMRYLIDNEPEYWKPLQEKYDPTESYKKKYLVEKEEIKIKMESEESSE